MPDLFDIVDAGFRRAQRAGDASVLWRHPLPAGGEATVRAAQLHIAADDAYRYPTPMAAVLGAARWIEDRCRREPDGWTRHAATGRTRFDGPATEAERAWVCPRHRDRLPAFDGGRLYCPVCARELSDAVQVAWPPRDAYAR